MSETDNKNALPEGFDTRVYRRHPDVSFSRFGDEGLLVVPHGAWQLVLNGVGLRVLELLDGERSTGQIADVILEEFDAPSREAVLADLGELLGDLSERGALEVV